jgi:hypothetical protein
VWTALLAVGWALMYLPQLPGSYHLAPSLPAPSTRGFASALYVSLAALGSVGSSDITPEPGWLRIVTVLETVVGLAMITAWITWVLSIYPVLAERRAFSRTVDVLRRAEPDAQDAIDHTPADALAGLLRGLAADIVKIDARLTQSAVTYYFQEHAPEATLSAQLPYVLALAHEAERCENETVRYHGRMLRLSIERLLRMIDDRFLQTGSRNPDELLTALAKDHLRQT